MNTAPFITHNIDTLKTSELYHLKQKLAARCPQYRQVIETTPCFAVTDIEANQAFGPGLGGYASLESFPHVVISTNVWGGLEDLTHMLAHELAHIIGDMDHSPRFYAVLKEISPTPEQEAHPRVNGGQAYVDLANAAGLFLPPPEHDISNYPGAEGSMMNSEKKAFEIIPVTQYPPGHDETERLINEGIIRAAKKLGVNPDALFDAILQNAILRSKK